MADSPIVIPVRHHSPACARLVRDLIREHQPQVVLIEGPSDASLLIPALLEPDTRPPVALMAYYQPGSRSPNPESVENSAPASLFYPFCDYSPEWVAMREGSAAGAEIRFCDLPAGPMLAQEEVEGPNRAEFGQAIANSYGFRTHEEWWEALFEGQRHNAETLIGLLRAYGEEVAGAGDAFTTLREQWMWQAVKDAMRAGAPADRVILVCGAAHAVRFPPLAAGKPKLPKTPAVEFALTPYTYAHLSRRSGYGAGNRSPLLFQRAWELGDLGQAAAAGLVETARALRERGWIASTADSIAACATAEQLAGLRNKSAPGADEIRLAARAAWSVSQAELMEGALAESLDEALIGTATGSVAESAGATPLSTDFYRRARRFWRNIDAEEREMLLKPTDPNDREKSFFLHQLRISGIDFAWLRDAPARADPGVSLRTRYEAWMRRWAPQTAMTLAQRSPMGASVPEVARQILREALRTGPPLSRAAAALQDAALCGLEELLDPALAAVDAASVIDSAWEDLSGSITRLNRLNTDTGLPEAVRAAASGLVTRLFARACSHLLNAARCTPERAPSLGSAIADLHEIAVGAAGLDTGLWWNALMGAMESGAPYISGLAAALLR
ncbi:MAG TPA: DUF5682 family protein, partial [Armatimonadota bacterium]|nr:DUF5682 family protein [Armatimonadota bacterium]